MELKILEDNKANFQVGDLVRSKNSEQVYKIEEINDFDMLLSYRKFKTIHISVYKNNVINIRDLFMQCVCNLFDDPEAGVFQLKSKDRHLLIALKRHLVCYILRSNGFTVKQIGDFVNRDHSTAINSIKTANNLLETRNPDFCKLFESVEMLMPLNNVINLDAE